MYKSGSPYLVCEELTDVARHRIPDAVVRGVTGLFDYEGALPLATGTATVLRTIADRLLGHAIRNTCAGSVFFLVRVAQTAVDRCDVVLDVADTSGGIDGARCDALNRALATRAAAAVQPDLLRGLDDVLLAGDLCRGCGGRLAVESLPGEGCVAQARVPVSCLAPIGAERVGEAGGAALWLIGQPPLSYEPLVRRFQRHDWAVRPFVTAAQALAGLGNPGARTPAMVVAIEHYGVEAGSLAALRERLPAAVTMVLLVLHGAVQRVAGTVAPGILLQTLPFSPRQVLHFTELGRHLARGTAPESFDDDAWRLQSRPRVLVADDDEVNRIIAVQVLRLLGFEAEAVEDGRALLAACRRSAPAAVLMDVEMPVLDGLAATRELRRLQQAGVLAAFPVIAATAVASGASRERCLAAGMNGCLRKPLHPAVLRNELLLCGVAAS